ncbi:MAG TPA: polyprenol monophosphomannose synthase [Thermomicrobiales bacterium]|nr:polyprenol monophosphomannose synthase [Thermomicrobiales bacterium]
MPRRQLHYMPMPSRRIDPTSEITRALVVMPTYCERQNVMQLIPAILVHDGIDVLVVDDGSPDGTAGAVRELVAEHQGRVHLIERDGKLGLGTAYLTGFRWALARDYTHVIEMDADFSHHPAALPRLLQASRYADLVIGSRYIPGGRTVNWPAHRKLISRGGSLYARSVLNLPVRDLTGGFKCFRRFVLESIDLDSVDSTGYAFQIELTYRAANQGFRVAEIPITFAERLHGQSKMDRSIVFEAVLCVLRLRFSQPRPTRPLASPFRSPGGSPGL